LYMELEKVKNALIFADKYDELELVDILEIIDELLKSSKQEMRDIYDSISTNTYNQKDDCMMQLIRKYCSIIWA